MATQLGLGSHKNLEQLYRSVDQSTVRILPEPGFSIQDGSAHSAGFDGWMTAAVFASLVRDAVRKDPRLCASRVTVGKERGPNGARQTAPRPPQMTPREQQYRDELFLELNPFSRIPRAKEKPEPGTAELIPPWSSEIWRRYGNKLRLGSAGVMDLAQE